VLISCFYWLFRHLLGLIVLRCRSEAANEVEILVPWLAFSSYEVPRATPAGRPVPKIYPQKSRLAALVARCGNRICILQLLRGSPLTDSNR
jgi:hypothetical protein